MLWPSDVLAKDFGPSSWRPTSGVTLVTMTQTNHDINRCGGINSLPINAKYHCMQTWRTSVKEVSDGQTTAIKKPRCLTVNCCCHNALFYYRANVYIVVLICTTYRPKCYCCRCFRVSDCFAMYRLTFVLVNKDDYLAVTGGVVLVSGAD